MGGTILRGPNYEDYSEDVSILGSSYFGKTRIIKCWGLYWGPPIWGNKDQVFLGLILGSSISWETTMHTCHMYARLVCAWQAHLSLNFLIGCS